MIWISLEILRAQFDIIITSHTFFNILSDKIGLNFVVIWHRMWQSRSRAFCETKKKQSLGCLLWAGSHYHLIFILAGWKKKVTQPEIKINKAYAKINKSSSSSSSFPFSVVDLWLKPVIFVDSFLICHLPFWTNWLQSSPWKLFYLYIWKKTNKTQNEIIWVLLKCKLNKM